MDIGCLDIKRISLTEDEFEKRTASYSSPKIDGGISDSSSASVTGSSSPKIDGGIRESASSSVKVRSSKESLRSSMNLLNKVTSQIKKPSRRKTSPVNWFPRKKAGSYLERKIRQFQEAGGMNNTLDETLGSSNPHYCRVEREKIAAREAASKAMLARKSAMVEASWCRILKAARIHSEEAESQLLKAQRNVGEALEAATAKGVIMYDTLDAPRKQYEKETLSTYGVGSTHTVRASFETAFDVDKQVTAAVKSAFIRLANSPSSLNKDEYKDLMRKISENPDTPDSRQDFQEISSEVESDIGLEFKLDSQDKSNYSDLQSELIGDETIPSMVRMRQNTLKSDCIESLVGTMSERLKCLQEEELASLATIVATCGLNAALMGEANGRPQDLSSMVSHKSTASSRVYRNSSIEYFMNGPAHSKMQVEFKVPSLDKFLVKRLTKLEREVQEARNYRNKVKEECGRSEDWNKTVDSQVNSYDLGSILVKHQSKLEKELGEMQRNHQQQVKGRTGQFKKQEAEEVPSLDKCLVKHVTGLERAVQEAKSRVKTKAAAAASYKQLGEENPSLPCLNGEQTQKENVDLNKELPVVKVKEASAPQGGLDTVDDTCGLDKILIKPMHRLEREKMKASSSLWWETEAGTKHNGRKQQHKEMDDTNCESLDKILVKGVSRLEKEKLWVRGKQEEEEKVVKRKEETTAQHSESGLGQILVKRISRLEREKEMVLSFQQPDDQSRQHPMKSHRQDREKELQEVWGGISLGDSIRPHVLRLQREKEAWLKAEEDERRALVREL